jgi:hypothetical protein
LCYPQDGDFESTVFEPILRLDGKAGRKLVDAADDIVVSDKLPLILQVRIPFPSLMNGEANLPLSIRVIREP